MSVADLIHAFRGLPSPRARSEALDAIACELTPHEHRHLHHVLARRTFAKDLVTTLPVELVACIFSHLDIAAPYRLRTVSTKWNSVLRAHAIIKPKVEAWYRGESAPSRIDPAFCRDQAERIHRLCTARPLQSISVQFRNDIVTRLAGNTLAWVTDEDDHRILNFFDFRTGLSWTAQTPSRKRIQGWLVSAELLVYWDFSGYCYASTFDGAQKKSFRTIQGIDSSISCRDRTVAYATRLENGKILVYIWEFDANRGRSFEIGWDESFAQKVSEGLNMYLFPQPKSRTLVVVGKPQKAGINNQRASDGDKEDDDKDYHYTITFWRYSFDGLYISKTCQSIHVFAKISFVRLRTDNHLTQFVLEVLDPLRSTANLVYDELKNRFLVQAVPPGPEWQYLRHNAPSYRSGPMVFSRFKDAMYRQSYRQPSEVSQRLEFSIVTHDGNILQQWPTPVDDCELQITEHLISVKYVLLEECPDGTHPWHMDIHFFGADWQFPDRELREVLWPEITQPF